MTGLSRRQHFIEILVSKPDWDTCGVAFRELAKWKALRVLPIARNDRLLAGGFPGVCFAAETGCAAG
jgi:hypothetical protein